MNGRKADKGSFFPSRKKEISVHVKIATKNEQQKQRTYGNVAVAARRKNNRFSLW